MNEKKAAAGIYGGRVCIDLDVLGDGTRDDIVDTVRERQLAAREALRVEMAEFLTCKMSEVALKCPGGGKYLDYYDNPDLAETIASKVLDEFDVRGKR